MTAKEREARNELYKEQTRLTNKLVNLVTYFPKSAQAEIEQIKAELEVIKELLAG